MLGQTVRDLEVVVVDDASTDADCRDSRSVRRSAPRRRPARRARRSRRVAQSRARAASGRYVARLDCRRRRAPGPARAPARAHAGRRSQLAVVGSSVIDVDEDGVPGRTHVLPQRRDASALARALQLAVLPPDGARRPGACSNSTDFGTTRRFWRARTTTSGRGYSPLADGDNLRERARAQAGACRAGLAAPRRRAGVLRSAASRCARSRASLPALGRGRGAGVAARQRTSATARRRAGAAFLQLLEAFERSSTVGSARARGGRAHTCTRPAPTTRAPACALAAAAGSHVRGATRRATRCRPSVRVAVVSPEPTPYRSPLFDRIAARAGTRPDRDLRRANRRRPHLVRRCHSTGHVFLRGFASRWRDGSFATTIR